ncbi:MAG: hypothetical protein DPW16_22160 [Chloroflexi bacterium]|nr:hypothetical protein [Chloroflexota bacterium]
MDYRAIVVIIRTETSPDQPRVTWPIYSGRAIYLWLLQRLENEAPPIANRLKHENRAKPLTASGLFQAASIRPFHDSAKSGTFAWFRITSLDANLSAFLDHLAETLPTQRIMLNDNHWVVESVIREATEHEWAQSAPTTQDIRPLNPSMAITLEFVTPTGFRRNDLKIPIPQPDLVFGSLERRWRELEQTASPRDINFVMQHGITLLNYHIVTQKVNLKTEGVQVGYVGRVTFQMKPLAQLETHPAAPKSLADHYLHMMQYIDQLASAAFFLGVGIKTTAGMGMARRLEVSPM